MQLEAQTADKEDKAEFQAKLRDHRATLARHKSDIVCPQPSLSCLVCSPDPAAVLPEIPRGECRP